MKKYIFFTLNDFKNDGGASIRMRSIVNALADAKNNVILISNSHESNSFNSDIEHINIGMTMSKADKRIFQFVIAFFPDFLSRVIFKKKLMIFSSVLNKKILDEGSLIFFEHLDNSIGLFLNKQKVIKQYFNDTHGSARLEFLHKNVNGIFSKAANFLKYSISSILDKKIYKNSSGTLFLSNAMKEYFEQYYPFILSKKNFVVPDGVFPNSEQTLNHDEVIKLKRLLNPSSDDRIILFAGSFKATGGVMDLIYAFTKLTKKKISNIKLILIGDGECFNDAIEFCSQENLENKIVFIGRTKHSQLRNYQELANIIVCPDADHYFSELVPHIKYFDSLLSGKIVINGSFAAIREINKDERLSINFQPSNVTDLAHKIEYALSNENLIKDKYKNNIKYVLLKHSYKNSAKILDNLFS